MFNKYPDIPKASSKRMGLYYQYVKTLENNQIDRVSSKEISKDLRIEAATVRRDLSYFGALGKKGYGYSVESLMTFFEDLFSDTHSRLMAVVGMDLLGKSLLHYPSFSAANMSVSCAFDFTDNEVGTIENGVPIYSISDFKKIIEEKQIETLLIACSGDEATQLMGKIPGTSITTILNFSAVAIHAPKTVLVRTIDFAEELQILFSLNSRVQTLSSQLEKTE